MFFLKSPRWTSNTSSIVSFLSVSASDFGIVRADGSGNTTTGGNIRLLPEVRENLYNLYYIHRSDEIIRDNSRFQYSDYPINNWFNCLIFEVACPVLNNPGICCKQSVRPDITLPPE